MLTRLALIDVGTNSVRLDVYQLYKDGHYERLHRSKLMVRLGQDVFSTTSNKDSEGTGGKLSGDGVKRAIAALEEFQDVCEELGVDEIRAIATSALRVAENGNSFIKQVRKKTGIELEVISGKEEAELILEGIRNDERIQDGVFGFIDIGGGSTEVGVCRGAKMLFVESFPLGAARLEQMFFQGEMGGKAMRKARAHIVEVFSDMGPSKKLPQIECMLGSSGTIKAVSRMLERGGRGERIRIKSLTELISELSKLSIDERREYPGMNPKRADIIVPGALILHEAMIFFRTPNVQFTKFSLRDGLLATEIAAVHRARARKRLKRLK